MERASTTRDSVQGTKDLNNHVRILVTALGVCDKHPAVDALVQLVSLDEGLGQVAGMEFQVVGCGDGNDHAH
eukprot:621708-Rhodomonas_salina.1